MEKDPEGALGAVRIDLFVRKAHMDALILDHLRNLKREESPEDLGMPLPVVKPRLFVSVSWLHNGPEGANRPF